MLELIALGWDFFEVQFAWFLVFCFILVALYHLHLWRRDRQRLAQLALSDKTIEPAENLPLVSLLVPAWNEAGNVEACIQSILTLRYPHKELILCAGGEDQTLAICRRFAGPGVIVLEQLPGEGKQHALQRCFEHAHGAVIFLTDADCVLEDRVFDSTLYPVVCDGKDATTGAWRPFNSTIQKRLIQFQWSHHLYREAWLPDAPPTLDGRNAAIQRRVVEEAQPFAGPAPTGTDYVQSKMLISHGFAITLARGSRVQTEYPATVKAYWKQVSRWFRTPLLMGRRWGDTALTKSTLRSAFYAGFLLFSIPFLFIRPWLLIWLMAVSHLALTQARMSDLAKRYQDGGSHPRVNFRLLQLYLPVGWIGLVGGLWDSILKKKSKRW